MTRQGGQRAVDALGHGRDGGAAVFVEVGEHGGQDPLTVARGFGTRGQRTQLCDLAHVGERGLGRKELVATGATLRRRGGEQPPQLPQLRGRKRGHVGDRAVDRLGRQRGADGRELGWRRTCDDHPPAVGKQRGDGPCGGGRVEILEDDQRVVPHRGDDRSRVLGRPAGRRELGNGRGQRLGEPAQPGRRRAGCDGTVDLRLRVGGGLVRSRRRETVDEDGEVVVLAVLVRRSGFEHVVTSAATTRGDGHPSHRGRRPNVAPVGRAGQRSAVTERQNGCLRRRPATRSGRTRTSAAHCCAENGYEAPTMRPRSMNGSYGAVNGRWRPGDAPGGRRVRKWTTARHAAVIGIQANWTQ